MKLEEIRKSYEDLSRTFSNTVRNLAISGIAIAWLFMTKEDTGTMMLVLIAAMFFFIITLFADLIQNYQLSITWYNYYTLMKDKHGRDENEDVKEPENKNKWGWRLYKGKLWTLVAGYILIIAYFICFVTGKNIT
jgi:magnesium-transporting ATPase (P-type)